jgi:hypothetical protein
VKQLGVVIETVALDIGSGSPLLGTNGSTITVWVELIREALEERGVPPPDALREATLLHGALLGVGFDLWDSGDSQRIRNALDSLADYADLTIDRHTTARLA